MLTKTVLQSTAHGGCQLIEVPFNWQHGDRLPAGAESLDFTTSNDALAELNRRGHETNRVHLPMPEKKPRPATDDKTASL